MCRAALRHDTITCRFCQFHQHTDSGSTTLPHLVVTTSCVIYGSGAACVWGCDALLSPPTGGVVGRLLLSRLFGESLGDGLRCLWFCLRTVPFSLTAYNLFWSCRTTDVGVPKVCPPICDGTLTCSLFCSGLNAPSVVIVSLSVLVFSNTARTLSVSTTVQQTCTHWCFCPLAKSVSQSLSLTKPCAGLFLWANMTKYGSDFVCMAFPISLLAVLTLLFHSSEDMKVMMWHVQIPKSC